nr:hypothetical protein [Tanacetum cinerariifolium]
QRVEDFQLGIESYQTQLNLTKPRWDATGFEYKHDYMIDEALDYRVKEFKVNSMNPGLNTRFWIRKDVDRSKEFMFAIQKRLKTIRIFRNLESFVGGRVTCEILLRIKLVTTGKKQYFTNSKAFRVFNSRTGIVEENLHVKSSENTPNIAGSGPNYLFDIDALTKSMNYKPVVVGNQSNGSAYTKACDNVGKTRVETVPDKDYILLPLWTHDPLFSSSSKGSPGAGYKPSGEEEKKDAKDPRNEDSEVPSTEEPRVNQEKDNVNSTNRVNVVSSTIKAATNEVNAIGRKSSIELPNDPNMPELEDISIFKDSNEDVFGAEADLNNLEYTFQVNPILITRIHKDHPIGNYMI